MVRQVCSAIPKAGFRIRKPSAPNRTPTGAPKLYDLLATAKNADTVPWDSRKASMWQIVFPQMANWLPEDEANQLRFEFAQELERLNLAA